MIKIKKTRNGVGIFTECEIKENSVILSLSGKELDYLQSIRNTETESHCVQTGRNQYIEPEAPFYFSNHSCDPNCGLNANLEFIAIRDIQPGEELLWDYSTSMLENDWTMKCNCGSENCRGIIEDFIFLPEHTRERYLKLKIVLPFITDVFEESNDINKQKHSLLNS